MIDNEGIGKRLVSRSGRAAPGEWMRVPLCVLVLVLAAVPALLGNDGPGYVHVLKPRIGADAPVPAPTGPVVLTVRGAGKGKGHPLLFDVAGLESLGTIRFTSHNKWMSKPVTYEGVKGSDFLEFLGVGKDVTQLKMRALNDYVVYIPVEDFRRWPVMLALKLDGHYMSVRDKGPLWVVYPNHIAPELMGPEYQGRWIWQLTEITLE